MTGLSLQVGATRSVLTATLGLPAQLRVRPDVGDERVVLPPAPADSDRRHVPLEARGVLAPGEKPDERLAVSERAVAGDRRTEVSLALRAVALGAGRLPLVLPELLELHVRGSAEPAVERILLEHLDLRVHD